MILSRRLPGSPEPIWLMFDWSASATEWVHPRHAEQALHEQKRFKGPLEHLRIHDVAIFKGSCAGPEGDRPPLPTDRRYGTRAHAVVPQPAFYRVAQPMDTVMIRRNPRGDWPEIAEVAFIDPTAIVCRRVIIEDDVFIGPYAVIRADETMPDGDINPILIKRASSIQDGVVIYSKSGAAVTVGTRTSIAHRSIVHGPCTIGDDVFVGFNSVLFNCSVGGGCVI